MKHMYVRLFLALFVSLFFVGFIPNYANADVNDFSFSSFDADYYLSKDSEGRSSMRVVERLKAEFSNYNQNKGIERAIPGYYDGHVISFKLESLTRNGQPEPIYEQRQDGEFQVVSTGTEEYVNGPQEYIFTYTLRDVVKTFGDHQELYWDTNGTGWQQRFDSVTARVHVDDSIKDVFTGEVSCYQGVEGSSEKCKSVVTGSGVTFSSNGGLSGYENLTFNLSFKAGTFTGYKLTFFDIVPYILLFLSIMFFVIMIIIKILYGRNHPGKGTIIPEYLPPKNVPVLLSAEIFKSSKNASTAQIIDFAVRHKIRITETEEKAFIGKTKKYTLELLSIDGLDQSELNFIGALFGGTQIGSKYTFNKYDTLMAAKMRELVKSIKKESTNRGYRKKQTQKSILQGIVISIAVLLIVSAFFMAAFRYTYGVSVIAVIIGVIEMAAIVVFKLGNMSPLTVEGRELFDYLKGFRMYIKLAEADRLKVLQSVEGAEKRKVNTDDKDEMIVLYERALPYAVLFGQERSWLKQLGLYYENAQTQPGWYSGVGAFNAAAFTSAVSGFSSYAGSSSFSSGSGAGGGGFSGGGGGGGGGGGR